MKGLNVMIIYRKAGGGVKIVLSAEQELMRVGVGLSVGVGRCPAPAIGLLYQRDLLPVMLEIARETERLHVLPEMYIIDTSLPSHHILILFRVSAGLDFLRQLFPLGGLRKMRWERAELIVASEADFTMEGLQRFLELYGERNYFCVCLLDKLEGVERPIWETELRTFQYGWPLDLF